MDSHSSEAPAIRVLRAAGVPVRRLEYHYIERGGTRDAAAQLGLCEHRIIKSLVFDDGQTPPVHAVMALMHGDARVSTRKLERLAGLSRLTPSSPENAERLTGYRPGGICPFALRTPLPVFIQESLFVEDTEELYINAGERGVIAAIGPEALRLLEGVTGDFMAIAREAHASCPPTRPRI